jgi:hypothetical protein
MTSSFAAAAYAVLINFPPLSRTLIHIHIRTRVSAAQMRYSRNYHEMPINDPRCLIDFLHLSLVRQRTNL